MGNPSTGFGGAGTEVLRRSYVNNLSNTETVLLDGVANHIYTVLSVVFHERATSTDEVIEMYVDVDDSGTTLNLMTNQPLGSYETFVWSDRFVMTETDELWVKVGSAASVDVYCSYIDQQLA
jgi:hypothetical protein